MLMKTASQSNDTPAGPKKQGPAAGPKGGFGMIFHIAVCSPDSVLRSRVERQCLDYYARRDDACIIEQLDSPEALLARATEPEYGPAIPVATASGLRVLPFADIEYLECTHHVVHFHLASGEDVPSLSVRVPFAQVAQPLLADERFVQLHRSYVVNLAAVSQLAAGEFWMQSGARVPVPRGREPAARTALKDYLEKQFR